MSVPANKVTQVITIPAGGTFVLPAGAKVLSMSGILTSDCLNLPTPEPMECFAFVSLQQNDQGGNNTEPWQENNIRYTGIKVDGKEHLFAQPVSWYNQHINLPAALKSTSLGPSFKDFEYNETSDPNIGRKAYFVFQTSPAIGNKMQIMAETTVHIDDSIVYEYLIPVYTRENLVNRGNDSVPECTL